MPYHHGLLVEPDCSDCLLKSHPRVPPEGNTEAGIAIVGEGPGRLEEKYGHPFIGPSGKILNRILRICDLDRKQDVFITNCGLHQPRPLEGEYKWYSKGEVKKWSTGCCRPRLLHELLLVRPKVIIAVGGMALETLTGKAGVAVRHGAMHVVNLQALADGCDVPATQALQDAPFPEEDTAYVLPYFHPAYLLRQQSQNFPVVVEGFRKAKRIVEEGACLPPRFLLISAHGHDPDGMLDRAEAWVDALVARPDYPLTIDVETNSKDPRRAKLTVFGLGCAEYRIAISLSVREWDEQFKVYRCSWNSRQLARIAALILKVMLAGNPKWYHNFGYDTTVLKRFVAHPGPVGDTLVLHHAWQPDLSHKLNFVCQDVQQVPAWKRDYRLKEAKGRTSDIELLHYNAGDCLYPAAAMPTLLARVFYAGNAHVIVNQLHMGELAVQAQRNGLPVDIAVWEGIRTSYLDAREKALWQMREAIRDSEDAEGDLNRYNVKASKTKDPARHRWISWDEFNPRSDRQARWFLYEFLNLKPVRMTDGGKEGRKKASHATKAVLDYLENDLVRAYVDFGEGSYAITNVLAGYKAAIDPVTERMHPSWRVTQKNFRWASSPATQNLTKAMREMLKQRPGRVWIGIDASQIEYRTAACFAGIDELLNLFNDVYFDEEEEPWKKLDPSLDAHSMVAAEVYGRIFTGATSIIDTIADVASSTAIQEQAIRLFFAKPRVSIDEACEKLADAVLGVGGDAIRASVERVFGGLKEQAALRTLVKRVVYALFYGAYVDKIYTSLREDRRLSSAVRAILTRERIAKIHAGFRRRFYQWDRWADREQADVIARNYQLIAPLDYKRYWWLSDHPGTVEATKLRNTPIQAAATLIVNRILWEVELERRRRGLDAILSIHLHDAGYYDTLEEHAEEMREVINERFDVYLDSYEGRRVHMYGQAGIGETVADVG